MINGEKNNREVKAIINASAEVVWRFLMKPETYVSCDPHCKKISANFRLGSVVRINSGWWGDAFMLPRVSSIYAPQKMVWRYALPFNLMVRHKIFDVVAKDDATSEIHIREIFEGRLRNIIQSRLNVCIDADLEFCKNLKQKIELHI